MYIAILGRQPALGIAELERLFTDVRWFSKDTAVFDATNFSIERVGGSQKAGRIIAAIPHADWKKVSFKLVSLYSKKWADIENKITLGISAYGFDVTPRDVQKTGLVLKSKLKNNDVSLRLIPNQDAFLNSASSHHNKLGLSENKVELLVIKGADGSAIIAESVGAQNITALAARDQGRPKRDAFVGMLPPKLAQIMINLAAGPSTDKQQRLLDPFCGTGVLLQEAALLGYDVYGSDLSEKMIRYSRDNLNWLADTYSIKFDWYLHEGDAVDTKWQQPIDIVAAETYLGQPFSAPPSKEKLTEVRGNCNHIISGFLKNLASQLPSGTPLCLAVPAWRDTTGSFTHLPLINKLGDLGYKQIELKTVSNNQLIYFREDQVVARELLLLTRS